MELGKHQPSYHKPGDDEEDVNTYVAAGNDVRRMFKHDECYCDSAKPLNVSSKTRAASHGQILGIGACDGDAVTPSEVVKNRHITQACSGQQLAHGTALSMTNL